MTVLDDAELTVSYLDRRSGKETEFVLEVGVRTLLMLGQRGNDDSIELELNLVCPRRLVVSVTSAFALRCV